MTTTRIYLEDDHCYETAALVVAIRDEAAAFDQTCFYPGGGGQPPDEGMITFENGETLPILSARADEDGLIWHFSASPWPADLVGRTVRQAVNRERRSFLSRYHTVLHVLNTIALRDYDGWITGVQIGADYSRIDFKLDGFSSALCPDMERKVNAVLAKNHPLMAYYLPEAEFRERNDLLRTLEVKPPVKEGRVRIVEIQGFDAQACGGTHVRATAEVGTFSIFRTENKGKINKRLYVRLA
ncbi:MAG: alanyl-tRNA editing protein [Deltaproteobacteria bacterium]|nr:alanyl-tRNA editing protein [Deltaproteobacteria bacterium]